MSKTKKWVIKYLTLIISFRYNHIMKRVGVMNYFVLALILLFTSQVFAVEVAPRISDREIIEGLANIRGDIKELRAEIKRLEAGQNAIRSEMKAEINAIRSEMKANAEAVDKRFEAVDKRFDDMNSRFDGLQWMLSLFITIALVILGFVLRMQWQMQRRQTQMEAALEIQKDELSFLKTLIEKLLPPRGVL
jgi:seryl-tRNA synthetase